MKLYICANGYTNQQVEAAEEVEEMLREQNHEIVSSVEESDLILSLGGDGALLRAFQEAFGAEKPLLGINSGRLGYLCALKQEEISDFDQILKQCDTVEKTVLECELDGEFHYALNDIIVSKNDFGQTVDLDLKIEDRYRYSMRGDGLIICTPTGSTAYNVSAYGPVLEDGTNVLAITPICAHTKDILPLVVSENKKITVAVNHDDAGVYADGKHIGNTSESVTVSSAERKLKLYVR